MYAQVAQPLMIQQPVQPLMNARAARRERNKSALYRLGLTELIVGIILILACIVCVVIVASSSFGFPFFFFIGILCGIFPIVSGILGVLSRKNSTQCLFITNMVMAIFTAIFMTILFSLSIFSVFAIRGDIFLTLLQVINCIGSLALFVIAIVHSVYCCSGSCCYSNYAHRQLFNGQVVFNQNQPFFNQLTQHAAPIIWQPRVGIVQPSTSNQYPQTQRNMNFTPKPETGGAENPTSSDTPDFTSNPNTSV